MEKKRKTAGPRHPGKDKYPVHHEAEMITIPRAEYDAMVEELRDRRMRANRRWVSTDTRLPDPEEYVIVYGDDWWNGGSYAMLKVMKERGPFGEIQWSDGNGPVSVEDISYWTHFPAAPRGRDGN